MYHSSCFIIYAFSSLNCSSSKRSLWNLDRKSTNLSWLQKNFQDGLSLVGISHKNLRRERLQTECSTLGFISLVRITRSKRLHIRKISIHSTKVIVSFLLLAKKMRQRRDNNKKFTIRQWCCWWESGWVWRKIRWIPWCTLGFHEILAFSAG